MHGSNSGFPFDEAPLYNNASLFPADYGTSCTAWELDECAAMWPSVDDLGAWCCANWCYVDRSCPYADAIMDRRGLVVDVESVRHRV